MVEDQGGCANHFHQQIVAATLEERVLLLLQDNDNVAWWKSRLLISLAVECDALAILHALVNVHLQHLALGHHLLAIARLAAVLVLDGLARPSAAIAVALDLLDHAGAKLAELDLPS